MNSSSKLINFINAKNAKNISNSYCLIKRFILFQQTTTMLLIAVCLFASVYSALGMNTVYYRDGQVCELCSEQHNTVPYRETYTPEEVGKRVVYGAGSRPISSSSYVVNRDSYAYSTRNLSSFIYDLCCHMSFYFKHTLITEQYDMTTNTHY